MTPILTFCWISSLSPSRCHNNNILLTNQLLQDVQLKQSPGDEIQAEVHLLHRFRRHHHTDRQCVSLEKDTLPRSSILTFSIGNDWMVSTPVFDTTRSIDPALCCSHILIMSSSRAVSADLFKDRQPRLRPSQAQARQ
jgi:hypothetical protein